MQFCWMNEPNKEAEYEAERTRQDVMEEDVLQRAALLRRLGYSQAEATHRCMGNVAWAFSVQGKPAISAARLRKLVASVYKSAS